MSFEIGDKVKIKMTGEVSVVDLKRFGLNHVEYFLAHVSGKYFLENELELITEQDKEQVDHPSHYNQGKYEVIDVIEDWNLDFHLANAIKYIARAEHKGKYEEDIEKAIWYLERRLKNDK